MSAPIERDPPRWRLPVFAAALLIAGVGVHFADAPGGSGGGAGRRVFCTALAVGVVALAVQWLWPHLRMSMDRARQAIAGCMAFSFVLIVFLLPPFQGPDEKDHWQTALMLYRSDPLGEPALLQLHEILDADRVCQKKDQKFNAERLHAPAPSERAEAPKKIGYAGPLSYPVVGAVSFFFPKVQTTQEALLFYYLCRMIPALLLIALLWWLCRHADVPFCALFFLSLPLVQQQFTVVNTDTLISFCAIASVLLTIVLWREFSWRLWIVLALVALIGTYAKFPLGATLLFPLLFLPYKRLPLKPVTVPLLLVAAAIAIFGAMMVVGGVLAKTGGRGNPPEVAQFQIATLGSLGGLRFFLSQYWDAISGIWFLSNFSSNLGWLETELNGHHLFLIKLTAYCAILLDAWIYFPRLPHALRTRMKGLIAGVALSVACFFIISLAYCAIMFISETPPGHPFIAGVQARYYFPAIFIALLMPMLVFAKTETPDEIWPPLRPFREWTELPAITLATAVIPFLMFARCVELFKDLMQRFW